MSARRERWLWLCAMCAASVALVWAIASVPYVPTHDGPSHILSGHIENHFDDPGTIYARHLSRAPQYASRGFALLFRPFERWLGWMGATKAALAIATLVGVWATAWMVVRIEPKRRWSALFAFAFAFPWALYMGFFSYFVSTVFGVGIIAFVVGRDLTTPRWRVVLVLALALHAHLHVFAALVTSVTVFVILVMRAMRAPAERRVREALLAAGLVLPPFVLLAWASLDVSAYREMSEELAWRSLSERVLTLPRLAAPGPIGRGLLALVVVGGGIWTAWFRHKRGEAHRDEPALACCALGWLVLAAAGPFHVPGWQYVSPRFFEIAVALGIALLGVEPLKDRRRHVFAFAVTLIALFSLERARALHATMYSGCADAFSGLGLPITRTKVQLGFVVDPHCGVPADPESSPTPYVSPLEHVASLYATAHGGTLPMMFVGSPSIHAFMPRELGPEDELPIPPGEGLPRAIARDPEARAHAIALVAAHAEYYESFLLFGARPDEIDAVLARGFVPRWRQGGFVIAEPRGCPIELVVVNPPPNGSMDVGYAPWPANEEITTKSVPLSGQAAPGPLRVALPHSICGDVWIRPIWRSGTTPPRLGRCAGSTPDGKIVVPAKAGTEIPCRLALIAQE